MVNNPYSTATMTKTVSGTKLLAATLALYAAGGVSLAVLPMATKSTTATTSYTTTVVESSCTENPIYLSDKCVATYSSFTASCHDGRRFTQTLSSCKTAAEISTQAKFLCQGRSNPKTGKVGLNGYSVGTPCESTYKRAEMNCPSTGTTVVVTSSCAVASTLVSGVEAQCSCSVPDPILRITTDSSNDLEYVPLDDYALPSSTLELAGFRFTSENGPVLVDKFSVSLRNGENTGPAVTSIDLGQLELWHIEERVEVPVNKLLSRATSRIVGDQIVYTFNFGTPIVVYPENILPVYIRKSHLQGPLNPASSPASVFTVVVSGDTSDFIRAESLDDETLSSDSIGGDFSVVGSQQNFSPYGRRYLATGGIMDLRNQMGYSGSENMELGIADISSSTPNMVYRFSVGANDSLSNPASFSNYASTLENSAILMKVSARGLAYGGSIDIAYIKEVSSTERIYPSPTPTSTARMNSTLSSSTTERDLWFKIPTIHGSKTYEVFAYLNSARFGIDSWDESVNLQILFDGDFGYQFGNRNAEVDWSDGPVYYQSRVAAGPLSPIQMAWKSPRDLVMSINVNGW